MTLDRIKGRRVVRLLRSVAIPFVLAVAGLSVVSLSTFGRSNFSAPRDFPPSFTLDNALEKYGSGTIIPEYNRSMKRVMISLAKRDVTLEHHQEILSRLPEYSQIDLLLPESNLLRIRDELKNKTYRNRIRLVPYDEEPQKEARFFLLFPEREKLVQIDTNSTQAVYHYGSIWAQDLFEVASRPDGGMLLLVPCVDKWFRAYGGKSSGMVISDTGYLRAVSSHDIEVLILPVTFDGGNILVDEVHERRIAYCGANTLRCTRTVMKSTTDSNPSDDQIQARFKEYLRVDEVIVIGRDSLQPPSLMFHLDQAMIILNAGVVGVTRVVGRAPEGSLEVEEIVQVERFLSNLRTTLLRLGYRIVNIDISIHNLLNHQQYVNAIPYTHAETGRKTLLVPVFPATQTPFEEQLIEKNTAAFESVGYDVALVPTQVDKLNGGIHCLVNVLE